MAANRPFANLDKLSKLATPAVPLANPNINQGAGTNPIPPITDINQGSSTPNTKFAQTVSLADRTKQPILGSTRHLAQYTTSDIATGLVPNTNFAKTISLVDRLKQRQLGTTNHLAQYLLSDSFLGRVRVKKPSELAASGASIVQIKAPIATPPQGGELPHPITLFLNQGSTDPTLAKNDFRVQQGIILTDGQADRSRVTPLFPSTTLTKVAQQGAYNNNGILFSRTVLDQPEAVLNQGSVDILLPSVGEKEKGGLNPALAVDVLKIRTRQGIVETSIGLRSYIDPTKPTQQPQQGIVTVGATQVSTVDIASPPTTVNQGFTTSFTGQQSDINPPTPKSSKNLNQGESPALGTPSAPDDNIKIQGISLRNLGYFFQSVALEFTPVITQGGEQPQNESPTGGGHLVVNTRSAVVSALLNPPPGTYQYNSAQFLAGGNAPSITGAGLDRYDNAGDVSSTIQYGNVEAYGGQQRAQAAIDILNQQSGDDIADALVLVNPDNAAFANLVRQTTLSRNSSVKNLIDGDGSPNKNSQIADTLGIGGKEYTDLTGDDGEVQTKLGQLLAAKLTTQRLKEARGSFTGTYKFYGDVTNYNQIIQAVNRSPYSNAVRPGSVITVSGYGGGGSVTFDAFLKSFSDGLTTNYTDFKHIGVQDTFKVYTGAVRQLSIAFTAVAMPNNVGFTHSDTEASGMLGKVDSLMKVCGVGSPSGQYVKAPIVQITIAGIVSELICACNSVKVDVPVTETAWDVDSEIPHQFDISLDLAVLAMEGGSLLSKGGKLYTV